MKPLLQNSAVAQKNQQNNLVFPLFGLEPRSTYEPEKGIMRRLFQWAHRSVHRDTRLTSIVIVLSHTQNYWEVAAAREMIESLNKAYGDSQHFEYLVFSANNDRVILDSIAREELLGNSGNHFDVCIAFAPWVVSSLRNLFLGERTSLPLIFGGLATPDRLGLFEHGTAPMEGLAGVITVPPCHNEAVKTIRDLKPELTELLVPYDSILTHAGLTEKCYGASQSLIAAWKKHGGKVRALEIQPSDNIAEKIIGAAQPHTLVNLSCQSSVIAQADAITAACNMHNIPLYAHDRQGVRRGAVLGTGSSGTTYGPWLASLVGQICIEKAPTTALTLPLVNEQKEVCYFEPGLATQGFEHLDDATLRKMRMLPIQHVE